MKVIAATLLIAFLTSTGSEARSPRFRCSECVGEMHDLGWMAKVYEKPMMEYLQANYCPTLQDPTYCEHNVFQYYPIMLRQIMDHFIIDNAVHICQMMGECDAKEVKEYTCEECIYGLEYVERYLKDEIMINEMVVYLEQNLCPEFGDELCTEWPCRSSSSLQRFATRSQCVGRQNPQNLRPDLPPSPSRHVSAPQKLLDVCFILWTSL